jgi:hypothetical protein
MMIKCRDTFVMESHSGNSFSEGRKLEQHSAIDTTDTSPLFDQILGHYAFWNLFSFGQFLNKG